MEITSSHKYILHEEKFSQNTYWTLAGVRRLKLQERSLHNQVGSKGKKTRNRDMTWTLGRELWNRKGSLNLGSPLPGGRSATTEREPQRRKRATSSLRQAGQTDEHRRPVSPACWDASSGGRTLGEDGGGCVEAAWSSWSVALAAARGARGQSPDLRAKCHRQQAREGRAGPPQQPHSRHAHSRHAPPLRALGARKCGPTHGRGADVRALCPQLCHLWAYSATAAPHVS